MKYRTYIRRRKSRGRQEWLARVIWEDIATRESGEICRSAESRSEAQRKLKSLTLLLNHSETLPGKCFPDCGDCNDTLIPTPEDLTVHLEDTSSILPADRRVEVQVAARSYRTAD